MIQKLKTQQNRSMKPEADCWKKINKIDRPVVRLIKKKRKKSPK